VAVFGLKVHLQKAQPFLYLCRQGVKLIEHYVLSIGLIWNK
jgi:hypothetical protein